MAAKDLRTVFIRGISFDADEKDIESAFSDVGPVKQCFLVRVKGQPKHRGFGFVQYALPEDAERAVGDLNGKNLKGRKLQVELADKRAPLEERKKKRKLGQEDASAGAAAASDEGNGSAPAAATLPATPPAAVSKALPPPAKRQRPERGPTAAAGSGPGTTPSSDKHKLLRAVAVGNLTPAAISQAIALARKAAPVEEVLNPAPKDVVAAAKLEADGCSGSVIVVVYKTVKDAMTAVTRLHNHTLVLMNAQQQQPGPSGGKKGRKNKKQAAAEGEVAVGGPESEGAGPQATEEDGAAPRITLWAREVKGEGAHVKQWRVIVRNLPFKVTEAVLRKALEPVGFVWELRLPRNPDGRIKGFAFAAFTCRAHAEKAIATLNGKELAGRMVVVDWAVSKNQYVASKGTAAEGGVQGAAGEVAGAGEDDNDPDRPESEEAVGEEDGDDEEEEDEEEGEQESFDEEGDDDDDDDDDEMEDEDEGEEEEEEEEEEEDLVDEEEAAVQRERGMLNNVLSAVLAEHEEPPGPAGGKVPDGKAAAAAAGQPQKSGKEGKAVGQKRAAWQGEEAEDEGADDGADDEEGKRPAARSAAPPSAPLATTVFVRGLPLDVTGPQLQARLELFGPVKACRLVMDKASGKPKGTAFVEFKEEGAATKAAEACARGRRNEGPGITLAGRPVEVDIALSGEAARSLATQHQVATANSKDRRNLYLAKEGHITEGSAAWKGMSARDQAKRKRAAEEKNTKLRSPNFVVSATRLAVRNIPPSWNAEQLRTMFIDAVRQRATKEKPRIVQAKILKETDRFDASGARKSKGLGFVEFESHSHALVALRQLNNNPGTEWGRERRPIVEFTIESVKVLKQIEDWKQKAARNKQDQQRQATVQQGGVEGQGAGGGAAVEGGGADRPGKKAKKERRKAAAPGGEGAGEGTEGERRQVADKRASKRRKEGEAQAPASENGRGDQAGIATATLSKRQRQRLRSKERQEEKRQRATAKLSGSAAHTGTGPAEELKQQPAPHRQQQTLRKRRSEDEEMDRIAEQALTSTEGRANPKRRRRGVREEGEEGGQDRLDRLVQQYKSKLAGERPKSNPEGRSKAARTGGAGKGGAGGGKRSGGGVPGGRGKSAQGNKKGKDADVGGLAALVAGAASGGLRRWFDG